MDKQRNPWWYPPTTSAWAKGLKPVPPGPSNPLGTRWMGLDAAGVGIHGTTAPTSIGYSVRTAASACRCPTPSGSSSTSASARPSSFSRQLDAEIGQEHDRARERDQPAEDPARMARLADVTRERPPEQDQHAPISPAPTTNAGSRITSRSSWEAARTRVHYDGIVPDSHPRARRQLHLRRRLHRRVPRLPLPLQRMRLRAARRRGGGQARASSRRTSSTTRRSPISSRSRRRA